MEVEEELEPGTRLGEVTAIDEDIGENAAINYAIICEYNNVLFSFLNSSCRGRDLEIMEINEILSNHFYKSPHIPLLSFLLQMAMTRASSQLREMRITKASSG